MPTSHFLRHDRVSVPEGVSTSLRGEDHLRTLQEEHSPCVFSTPNPQIIQDFKEESEVVAVKEHPAFKISAARHPTIGKVAIIEGRYGDGIIVETEG